ncbi:hypothetical protein [Streptomyces sp. 4F14]|uniref:hypothetical protein n=1 Tax=Streptomyces sp. 4F14 TaxID=3394380 RepID=UPI003A887902
MHPPRTATETALPRGPDLRVDPQHQTGHDLREGLGDPVLVRGTAVLPLLRISPRQQELQNSPDVGLRDVRRGRPVEQFLGPVVPQGRPGLRYEEFGRPVATADDPLDALATAEDLTGAVRGRWVNAGVVPDEYAVRLKAITSTGGTRGRSRSTGRWGSPCQPTTVFTQSLS